MRWRSASAFSPAAEWWPAALFLDLALSGGPMLLGTIAAVTDLTWAFALVGLVPAAGAVERAYTETARGEVPSSIVALVLVLICIGCVITAAVERVRSVRSAKSASHAGRDFWVP